MNRERLQVLADFLLTVPVEKFDLATWDCGTTACAVGHACQIPEFKKAGLRLIGGSPKCSISFDGWYGRYAAQYFFDLTFKKIEDLFFADTYPKEDRKNPLAVRTRILELLDSTA